MSFITCERYDNNDKYILTDLHYTAYFSVQVILRCSVSSKTYENIFG